jgi:hypothetical protein
MLRSTVHCLSHAYTYLITHTIFSFPQFRISSLPARVGNSLMQQTSKIYIPNGPMQSQLQGG